MKRDFNLWLKTFTSKIASADYYVDFEKIYENVAKFKVEFAAWDALIGSKNIEHDFEKLITKIPTALACVPILLAVRSTEIFVLENEKEYIFRFDKPNFTMEEYKMLLRKSGLFGLFENHLISSVQDYVTGVEAGLDSNARKNRTGHIMEAIVEQFLKKSGLKKDTDYFTEMYANEIEEKWGFDLSALSNDGKSSKRFDFVIRSINKIFAIETNFYSGGGSKLNETARSYKTLALEAENIPNFVFVWITDGEGWKSAKKNLEETFDIMEHLYCINDLKNGILGKILKNEK